MTPRDVLKIERTIYNTLQKRDNLRIHFRGVGGFVASFVVLGGSLDIGSCSYNDDD